MNKNRSKVSVSWTVVLLGILAILVGTSAVVVSKKSASKVTDFESCVAAGNPVMESYPEQCAANGKTYTNQAQIQPMYPELDYDGSDYIGLAEEEALAKAKEADIPARVVEREGESLPATMDFVYGRLNLYVKGGNVYEVEVEGKATDGK